MTPDPQFAKLQKGIDKLIVFLDSNNIGDVFTMAEFSEMYTSCYDLCYKELTEEVSHLFKKNVEKVCDLWSNNLTVENFLKYHQKFNVFTKWIIKIFLYVIRIVDDDLEGYPELSFYQRVIKKNTQLNKLVFQHYINNKNTIMIKNYIQVLKQNKNVEFSTELYPEWTQLLETELNNWMKEKLATSTINTIFEEFQNNYNIISLPDEYLEKTTKKKFKDICVLKYSDKYLSFFKESKNVEFAAKFFKLIKDDNKLLKNLSDIYSKNIVLDTTNIEKLCESLKLEIEKIDNYFEKNTFFTSKLNAKVEHIINNPETTWLETIIDFIHQSINKNHSNYFDTFVCLIELCKDKDIIEKLYRKKLSSRLVKKCNLDIEREFLSKLKTKLGFQYINKSETMIKDMLTNNIVLPNCFFKATILQHGAWPFEQSFECITPEEIQNLEDKYTATYIQNFPSRKLTWYYNQGTVSLNYNKYTLIVSPVQASVILWLNKQVTPISIECLIKLTNMKAEELLAILDSLKKTGVNIIDINAKGEYSLKSEIESNKQMIKYKMPLIKKKTTKVMQKKNAN